ncbi:MAG TPA: Smr/MutS family protein [Holophagaceae bacterium]|nr:Smr/MutS family protein [Holophagaceae bacterium]
MAYSRDIDGWNMVWKQDLAKLKQTLDGAEETPPLPPPKPKAKPAEIKPLDDEDALFLSAMGVRRTSLPAVVPLREAPVAQAAPPQAAELKAPEPGFQEALKELKGLKPMKGNPVLTPSAPPSKTQPLKPEPRPVSPPLPVSAELPQPPAVPAPVPVPEAGRHLPLRIQLAAGMAVEVDGHLDLRHHSVQDAEERLKDRLADAVYMGWRTLHVTFGPDADLHAALLKLLEGGALPMVARFAQAPIPMGGAQAWVLYLVHPEA